MPSRSRQLPSSMLAFRIPSNRSRDTSVLDRTDRMQRRHSSSNKMAWILRFCRPGSVQGAERFKRHLQLPCQGQQSYVRAISCRVCGQSLFLANLVERFSRRPWLPSPGSMLSSSPLLSLCRKKRRSFRSTLFIRIQIAAKSFRPLSVHTSICHCHILRTRPVAPNFHLQSLRQG
jgi:hypothetical protein